LMYMWHLSLCGILLKITGSRGFLYIFPEKRKRIKHLFEKLRRPKTDRRYMPLTRAPSCNYYTKEISNDRPIYTFRTGSDTVSLFYFSRSRTGLSISLGLFLFTGDRYTKPLTLNKQTLKFWYEFSDFYGDSRASIVVNLWIDRFVSSFLF
jgi:hypothetical protein